jgi:hypothetical protein
MHVSDDPYAADMQPKKPRRKPLKSLTCPECQGKGLFRTILWGMPDDEFDHVKYASGGCIVPSPWPPDCQCSGCGFEGYRDVISGFGDYPLI